MLTAVSPLLTCAVAQAQKRASPHETVSLDLGGDKITITYGRPYLKGRQVGEQVAPFNEVWRLGADEATKITVTARTKIGDSLELAPGSYALFAIPQPDKWTIIVNKVADQWGAFKYDQSQDLGRFDVKVTPPSSPVEQFTISMAKQGSNTATLTFGWGKASVSTTLKAA
jgi:Protein of unknown function (DUF2911)